MRILAAPHFHFLKQRFTAAATIMSPPSDVSSSWKQSAVTAATSKVGTTMRTTTRTFAASFSPDDRISAPRAARACELLPTYLSDARAVEKYSPSTPNGALQLSVAENKMLEDMLVPSLTEFSAQEFLADAIYYQPTHGRESFRKAFCVYLQDLLGLSKQLDCEGIVVGAGCNAVLENLCICLAEPGEGVMIPTPYYAAFEFDLAARAGKNENGGQGMKWTDDDQYTKASTQYHLSRFEYYTHTHTHTRVQDS
jgi:hypothetical protein